LAPGHHRQEYFIGTKAAIAKNLQLALVAGVMANGPPEPPQGQNIGRLMPQNKQRNTGWPVAWTTTPTLG